MRRARRMRRKLEFACSFYRVFGCAFFADFGGLKKIEKIRGGGNEKAIEFYPVSAAQYENGSAIVFFRRLRRAGPMKLEIFPTPAAESFQERILKSTDTYYQHMILLMQNRTFCMPFCTQNGTVVGFEDANDQYNPWIPFWLQRNILKLVCDTLHCILV